MIQVDISEVFSIAATYVLLLFLSTFFYLNFKETRDCGMAFGHHFANAKCYSRGFSEAALCQFKQE